jgi:DNA polymerase-1
MILKAEAIKHLSGRIAFDVETQGGSLPWLGTLVGLSVWCPDSNVYGYVPCDGSQEQHSEIIEAVKTWTDGSYLIGHNIKYELHWLDFSFEDLARFKVYDTAVGEHLINEEYTKDLGSLEARYLKTKTKKGLLEEATPFGGIKNLRKWPVRLAAEYCQNDSRITYEVAKFQIPKLKSEDLSDLLIHQTEYLRELYAIEHRGIVLDMKYVEDNMKKADYFLHTIYNIISIELSKVGVQPIKNFRSAQQLSKLLYTDLGIPKPICPPNLINSPKAKAYTSTCTSKPILQQIKHPVISRILDWKAVTILLSYMQKYHQFQKLTPITDEQTLVSVIGKKKQVSQVSQNRFVTIHANFNLTGTVTGRLSCSKPNMQQVKSKYVGAEYDVDGIGFGVRPCFIARPGYEIMSIDYKQMEVVIFAMLSLDPRLLEIIATGQDAHDLTAILMFGYTDEKRRKEAKTINFAILYGLGIPGLAMLLGSTEQEAGRLVALYLATFSQARPYMQSVATRLANTGYIRYWSGRKRRISSRAFHYKGVNAEVQGGCADIIARAIVDVGKFLREKGDDEGILAAIHDELLIEIKAEQPNKEAFIEKIQELMSVPYAFGIPLKTDVEIGKRWGEKMKVKDSEETQELLELVADEAEEEL